MDLRKVIVLRLGKAGEERVRAGEGVVVLIADADRRIEALGKAHRIGDRAAEDNAGAVEDHRKPGG